MKFKVGPWNYRIRISDGPLYDDQNNIVAGLCCWGERTIWISGTLPSDQRLDVFFHEMAHAWQEHIPMPADPEGVSNWASSFAVDVWRQVEERGGAVALMKLRADGVIHDESDPSTPTDAYWIKCGNCNGLMSLSDVRNGRVRIHRERDRLVMDRQIDCEHCNLTMLWTEGATTFGTPNGKIIGTPRMRPVSGGTAAAATG